MPCEFSFPAAKLLLLPTAIDSLKGHGPSLRQMLAGLTAASLPLGFSFSQYIVPLPALAVRYMDSR